MDNLEQRIEESEALITRLKASSLAYADSTVTTDSVIKLLELNQQLIRDMRKELRKKDKDIAYLHGRLSAYIEPSIDINLPIINIDEFLAQPSKSE